PLRRRGAPDELGRRRGAIAHAGARAEAARERGGRGRRRLAARRRRGHEDGERAHGHEEREGPPYLRHARSDGRRRRQARRDSMNPKRLSLAHLPPPIVRPSRLARAMGLDLWVKRDDMTGGAEAGNKIRKLELLLADAIEKGCDTVITCGGIQSNHAR